MAQHEMPARAWPYRDFNRSYYEETLVVRVHPEILANERMPEALVTRDIWENTI